MGSPGIWRYETKRLCGFMSFCRTFISKISVSKFSQITIINCGQTMDGLIRRTRRVNVLGQWVQECFDTKDSEGQWSIGAGVF